MASLDRPRGFAPVAKRDGSPWNSAVRNAGTPTAADIFMHDFVKFDSTNVLSVTATNDVIAGTAVGFGKNPTDGGVHGGLHGVYSGFPFDPDDRYTGSRYFDTSASTASEWTIFIVDEGNGSMLFEGQQDDGTDVQIGDPLDIVLTHSGSTTTGLSGMEINGNATTNDDVTIFMPVTRPDVAATDANADWIVFVTPGVLTI